MLALGIVVFLVVVFCLFACLFGCCCLGGFFWFSNLATDKQMSNEVTQEKDLYLYPNCIVNIMQYNRSSSSYSNCAGMLKTKCRCLPCKCLNLSFQSPQMLV